MVIVNEEEREREIGMEKIGRENADRSDIIASAFPTAGGLYHWASILGGRGWGWLTAWFNLAGLITVLAAINCCIIAWRTGPFGTAA